MLSRYAPAFGVCAGGSCCGDCCGCVSYSALLAVAALASAAEDAQPKPPGLSEFRKDVRTLLASQPAQAAKLLKEAFAKLPRAGDAEDAGAAGAAEEGEAVDRAEGGGGELRERARGARRPQLVRPSLEEAERLARRHRRLQRRRRQPQL